MFLPPPDLPVGSSGLPGSDPGNHVRLDQPGSFFAPGPEVRILRLDRIHPEVSGNKWFKLRYYLQDARSTGKSVVTFGGPWSNHILATASACRHAGLDCSGIINGEEPVQRSVILDAAAANGMELHFISRSLFRELMQAFSQPSADAGESPTSGSINQVPDAVKRLLDPTVNLVIPAGGYGAAGALGASTILRQTTYPYTHIIAAAGTGTMLAGLINGAAPGTEVLGIPVLRHRGSLVGAIAALLDDEPVGWNLRDDFHFGGYAKYTDELTGFMNRFYQATSIPLDFVYTGKMIYALDRLIRDGFFPADARILAIHSGGVAGNQGLPKGLLIW